MRLHSAERTTGTSACHESYIAACTTGSPHTPLLAPCKTDHNQHVATLDVTTHALFIWLQQVVTGQVSVYAISDLHTDHKENLAWVKQLRLPADESKTSRSSSHPSSQQHDVLIVAGDVSDDLALLRCAWQHVFPSPLALHQPCEGAVCKTGITVAASKVASRLNIAGWLPAPHITAGQAAAMLGHHACVSIADLRSAHDFKFMNLLQKQLCKDAHLAFLHDAVCA